jgi:hypothetical protein
MSDLKDIETRLSAALELVDSIKNERALWFGAVENNVFSSMEEAEGVVYARLKDEAYKDCEGTYTQEFIVNGVHYIGTLSVEYNRHDKTYYYIETTHWKGKLKMVLFKNLCQSSVTSKEEKKVKVYIAEYSNLNSWAGYHGKHLVLNKIITTTNAKDAFYKAVKALMDEPNFNPLEANQISVKEEEMYMLV